MVLFSLYEADFNDSFKQKAYNGRMINYFSMQRCVNRFLGYFLPHPHRHRTPKVSTFWVDWIRPQKVHFSAAKSNETCCVFMLAFYRHRCVILIHIHTSSRFKTFANVMKFWASIALLGKFRYLARLHDGDDVCKRLSFLCSVKWANACIDYTNSIKFGGKSLLDWVYSCCIGAYKLVWIPIF